MLGAEAAASQLGNCIPLDHPFAFDLTCTSGGFDRQKSARSGHSLSAGL